MRLGRQGHGVSGPLRAGEVAEAAVLADLTVALCLAGWFLPFGTILVAAAVTPMAALAARHRFRAACTGLVIALALSVLIAGTSMATNVLGCGVLGGIVGLGHRRSWGPLRTIIFAVVAAWPPASALAVAALTVLSQLRTLTLANAVNSWQGLARLMRRVGLRPVAGLGDHVMRWSVTHWQLTVPIGLLGGIILGTLVAGIVAGPALERLDRALPAGPVAPLPPTAAGRVDPVPIVAEDLHFRYAGAAAEALAGVSLRVEPGEFVAIVGPNGSGKSTLARLLAGLAQPDRGRIQRPGGAGVGRAGGTAVIFQRPETQVLGVRVRDDVLWGLPRGHGVDTDALLRRVGLAGMGERETATLSGGELQRLAVAAALARGPRLLISDESTAMVDAEGREQLTELLARLSAEDGIAVVHVTHRPEEAAAAHRVVALREGRVVDRPPPARAPAVAPQLRPLGPPLLRLEGVSHVYAQGTPWEHEALRDVDLTVARGESLLVLGHNGSGKSTLAWIIAGLTAPTAGAATLDGRPLGEAVGEVSLSFQHARLQLLRSTVGSDVTAASGRSDLDVAAALEEVGLDAGLADRRVEELSGGQVRRVALAGLLAARPQVLVLDEPFAGLDEDARRSLLDLLCRLRDQRGLTLVLVSHDVDGADELVDRAVVLRQGRIVADVRRGDVVSMAELFAVEAVP